MKLFDGSTNYELGSVFFSAKEHKPATLQVEIYKDTSVKQVPGKHGEPVVCLVGKEYMIPELHNDILQIDVQAVGTFSLFATSPETVKHLKWLTELAMKHHQADLYLTVKLRGPSVLSEPGMAPFEIKMLAKPGSWSAFPWNRGIQK